jgi:APA family basic amino acid/polyamine antiporter
MLLNWFLNNFFSMKAIMSVTHKLSLTTAILININIMIGVGVFINTISLANRAGSFGAISYLILGVLMLPLILSISKLLTIHPQGGFYVYAKNEINQFAGFVSAWSYFIAKLASATLMIHVSTLFLKELIPAFSLFNPFLLDLIFLLLFISLNMLHMKTGSILQMVFTVFKLFPILFLIITGLFLFNGSVITPTDASWVRLSSTLPLVLYAILGFEAACSLSSQIHNPSKNASRAVLISFGIVICMNFLYQFIFYGVLGESLAQASDYRSMFPLFIEALLGKTSVYASWLITGIHICIASSALSAAYGIIFSNTWNLYTLAQNNHIPGAQRFLALNRYDMPWLCILAQGCICIVHLIATQADQIPLQITGALGSTIGYTLSVLSLLVAKINRPHIPINGLIPVFGLMSCLLLISSCLYGLFNAGIYSLYSFCLLLSFGVAMYVYTSKKN